MQWTPISLAELLLEIKKGEDKMSPLLYAYWQQIKISPIKWQEFSYGLEGNGFWIVAKNNNGVIYYNDIEEGFNYSTFEQEGIIDNYSSEQDELQHTLLKLNKLYIEANLYIDQLIIGKTVLQIIDDSMGVLTGNLIPNENYKVFQPMIINQINQKGISNTTDYNYILQLEDGKILQPQGGIGVIHSTEFSDEIIIETAGNNLEDLKNYFVNINKK